MGDDKSRRVGSALSALVESLIPRINDEDDASLDERRDEALALATSIINELNGSQPENKNQVLNGQSQLRAFEDAFSPNGLPLLPTRDDRPQQSRGAVADGAQRHRSQQETMPEISDPSQQDKLDATDFSKPSESSLLHNLPFTLQGLSSTHLAFSPPASLDLPPTLSLPIISLLHTLAEPSLLYRALSDFVESRDEGLVGQSLRSAIGIELRSYLGLIATLEGEIRRAIASVNPKEPCGGVGKAGVTLRRCVVWTRDATMGLRLMSLMAEEAKST
ncbi:MAG: hypothetical protein Q9196_002709 [Gyalolechia fulgens]